jgi:hypothetical protein
MLPPRPVLLPLMTLLHLPLPQQYFLAAKDPLRLFHGEWLGHHQARQLHLRLIMGLRSTQFWSLHCHCRSEPKRYSDQYLVTPTPSRRKLSLLLFSCIQCRI